MADHLQEDWRARAEAARGVAELMQDPIGKQAMLDVADACEQLANSPMLAKVTRIWPDPRISRRYQPARRLVPVLLTPCGSGSRAP